MPIAAVSAQQAASPLARAVACATRATQALEQLEQSERGDPKMKHDLRGLLGTLVAGMQLLDGATAESDIAVDAQEIVQRYMLRIDQILDAASWGPT